MRPIIGLFAWLVSIGVWAQTDSTKSYRLRELSTEVANLTRSPLGEGDLILKQWVKFSVEERGKTRTGIIRFTEGDSALIWQDDINRSSSLFYRASPTAPLVTIVPGINQGTQLNEDLMAAIGYYNDSLASTGYEILKEYPQLEILGVECKGGTSIMSEENTDLTTLWVGKKGDFKKSEREVIKRAVKVWASNQPKRFQVFGAEYNEDWVVLGIDEEGMKFRIVEWEMDDDFAIALDKIMVNVPGRDIKQIAKEYYEEHMNQKED